MSDRFAFRPGLESPPENAFAITPSDAADVAMTTRAIWVGGPGDIKLTTKGGDTVTYKAVPAGRLSIRAVRVWSTGTTATNMIGEY
jgi:hypothetical protein